MMIVKLQLQELLPLIQPSIILVMEPMHSRVALLNGVE